MQADLNSKWCNVLCLVDVVVEPGGEGEEAVGGDVHLVHQVAVEGEGEQRRNGLRPDHHVGQTYTQKNII